MACSFVRSGKGCGLRLRGEWSKGTQIGIGSIVVGGYTWKGGEDGT